MSDTHAVENIYVDELIYTPGEWVLFNPKEKHSVINLDNRDRVLVSYRLKPGLFGYPNKKTTYQDVLDWFKNEYKLMGQALVNEKLKTVKFKGASWQVDFEPSVTSITRMKLQAAAHTEESVFLVKTEGKIGRAHV